MFLAAFPSILSRSLLQICETEHLSYERAAERCNLSTKHFGNIVREKTSPRISTLEKICIAFDKTPDQLLLSPKTPQDFSFRAPMPVTQIRCFQYPFGLTGFPVCPRCRVTIEREHQRFCDRCGQCLGWKNLSMADLILPEK